MTTSDLTAEQFAAKGDAIYERDIRQRAEPSQNGKFVVINIDTGSYEIDDDEQAAAHRLLAKEPGGRLWFRLVGSPYAHRFAGHRRKGVA